MHFLKFQIYTLILTIENFTNFVQTNHMNEKKALEKLQSMAEDSKDSLKKFLAKEILTYDEPLDFFALAKKFGMETIYHYEDISEQEMEEFYNTYSKEILQIQQESKVEHQTDRDRSWFSLEKTTEKISKDLDLER